MGVVTVCTIVSLFILSLTMTSVEADACAAHANGCSTPFNMNYFYKRRFTPACNRHDICYFCAVKFGKDRRYCDKKFLRDMKRSCDGLNFWKKILCKLFVSDYFAAVRLFGSSHFEDTSASFCDQSFVRGCIF